MSAAEVLRGKSRDRFLPSSGFTPSKSSVISRIHGHVSPIHKMSKPQNEINSLNCNSGETAGVSYGRRCRQAIGRGRELDATSPSYQGSSAVSRPAYFCSRRSLEPVNNTIILAGHCVHTGQLMSPIPDPIQPIGSCVYTNAAHVVESRAFVYCRRMLARKFLVEDRTRLTRAGVNLKFMRLGYRYLPKQTP